MLPCTLLLSVLKLKCNIKVAFTDKLIKYCKGSYCYYTWHSALIQKNGSHFDISPPRNCFTSWSERFSGDLIKPLNYVNSEETDYLNISSALNFFFFFWCLWILNYLPRDVYSSNSIAKSHPPKFRLHLAESALIG